MDQAGRTISVTDAAGAITTTAYDIAHDQPSVVTDAMGNTSCYKYDHRGRKIAEWGTALQPACFEYDDMDNMTSLRTFRADGEVITTDPSERSDYDENTWAFHATTGLEMSKNYADNTSVLKTYDAYNRLATETDARGNEKTHAYEQARGLLLATTYNVVDGTAATADRSFTYNHLGLMTQVVDDAGARTFGYNSYGERETDSLMVDGDTHLITEQRDSFGRSVGYIYSKDGSVQQTVTTGYGDDGRICSAGFLHGGEAKNFGYTYLAGTNQLQVLTTPNGMTLTQTYDSTRNLLTGMAYHRGSTLVAQREYTYDILGRPTVRNTARQGKIVNDSFAHNTRSELVGAIVNNKEYEYAYDNIGNRQQASEGNDVTVYDANALNQHTAISKNGAVAFVPQFDADGNQTLIKTDAGIWSAIYNAENRPICFLNEASGTVVECAYDSQGRRAFKKVSINGNVTLHQHYIYRGYLQIACIDLTRSNHPALWFITWDPTQPVATRPLAIQKDATWYTYGWDLTKDICEMFGSSGYIRTAYTYTPYGEVTESVNGALQPIQRSCEYNDIELGMVYYNYRHYNPIEGRWIGRDAQGIKGGFNLYCYVVNNFSRLDVLGNYMLSYNPLFGISLQWNCTTARNQLINQIAEWKQMGHSVAAYFMEKFLDPNTPNLVEVKGDLLNELNRVGKEQMCGDFASIYSENGNKNIQLNQIKLRYIVGYMRNAYGGVRFTGEITQLNEDEINVKGKLEDYYAYSTGVKGVLSSLLSRSYSAALYLEENCSEQIKTFHNLANIDFSCCL